MRRVAWRALSRAGCCLLLAMTPVACTGQGSTESVDRPSSTGPAGRPPPQQPDAGTGADPEPDPGPEPEPEPEAPRRRLSLLVSGDVLLHSGTWATAAADAERRGRKGLDFRPMFAAVAPVVRAADLAICHLETPVAPRRGPYSNYPLFSVPRQVLPALRSTGYDACTTASNHSLDQGFEGVRRTLVALDRAGMPHDGTARSAAAQRRVLMLRSQRVQVAVLSYTYGTNGIPLPEGKPWSVSTIDTDRITREAARARRAGADVVAVALHFGTEYVTEPDGYQTEVVDQITRSRNVDVVYGHHAHVVQPVDRVHDTWVAYGLGNFIAEQETSRPYTYRGASVRFTFVERRSGRFTVRRVAYLPTMITAFDPARPAMRVLDVVAAMRDPATPAGLRHDLRAALADVRSSVLLRGAPVHLIRPAPAG